ncbi:hypothetical protein [Tenacibaculum finnmarkense]|uniref:hypothetical protein n=1 Tax=Tenacibaculum finnmarkense TaxID=2781243 RepID=UPI000C7B9F44|nr:hypothetical protein [Tenacibaculum finnmarkense]MCG8776456.1 hypothetical protein [Tenacibaculum finnmarkense]
MIIKNIIENWEAISMICIGTGSGGWLGWVFNSKLKKVEFHSKAFKINSEMIDAIKCDFEDRIKFLQELNAELTLNSKELKQIIKEQRDYISLLKKDSANFCQKKT